MRTPSTSTVRWPSVRTACLAGALLVCGGLAAQNAPPLADASAREVPTAEAIGLRIQSIEAATDLDDAVRTRALELLRQAQTRATDRETFERTLRSYCQLAETGAAEIQTIREALKAPPAKPDVSAQRLLSESEEMLGELDALINARWQAEADRVQMEAEQAREAVEDAHPALLEIAKENEMLGREQVFLTEAMERATRELRSVEAKLATTAEAFASARKKLETIGLSDILGEILLDQREPVVSFVNFADSALEFEVRVFVRELSNRARTRIVHELHLAIDRLFREHEIVIAFPQRDLHIKSDERSRSGFEPPPGLEPPPTQRELGG